MGPRAKLAVSLRRRAVALVVVFITVLLLPGVLAGGGDDPSGPCAVAELCESTTVEPTPQEPTRLSWLIVLLGLFLVSSSWIYRGI